MFALIHLVIGNFPFVKVDLLLLFKIRIAALSNELCFERINHFYEHRGFEAKVVAFLIAALSDQLCFERRYFD
ncbi:hypothetical protein L596_025183 [Steinernema carpocapsae]|uniref:Uncharacterized protein n=1 Tax=Steinernema carpocapsae TaxID=34508 RepID=A0A4U5M7W6_STECR|nr:hypothetical protein L596_025183 [Steinernema carpocapsae]